MMDSAAGEVQLLTQKYILQESLRILKSSLNTFILIALTLVLPLCVAMLTLVAFSLDPMLDIIQIPDDVHTTRSSTPYTRFILGIWTKLVLLQFVFPIAIFVFSLLSTAAVVFTVASLYTSRNVSFITILPAIPRIFRRLFITFLFISVLVILYQVVYFGCVVASLKFPNLVNNLALLVIAESLLSTLFYGIHSYLFVIWHIASVISVLEPVYGFAAMKRSRELLKGRTLMAIEFGYYYLCVFLLIKIFWYLILRVQAKLLLALVGCLLLGVLVIVTLIGLLVQTVFYYACKRFHHQEIDKNALSQLLDGYLSDQHVPLISNIEMQELEI